MALMISGLGVSRGVAIGAVHVMQRSALEIYERHLKATEVDAEVQRFQSAVITASQQLRDIQDSVPADAPKDIISFIGSHLLMLDDSMLSQVPIDLIRERQCNAEWALKIQRDQIASVFEEMEDEYLRTRQNDIDHVIHLIQKILFDQQYLVSEEVQTLAGSIIVADDLTPADTVLLQNQNIAGFITELGGPLSHTAIIARSLGIPAVVGVPDARLLLKNNETVIVDGSEGMILAGVDQDTITNYQRKQKSLEQAKRKLHSLRKVAAKTQDNVLINLQANVELLDDTRALANCGADGVGLYRTEFLYIDRTEPANEAEQYEAYVKVIRLMKGRPVTIRTLDIGAEKEFDPKYQGPLAQNPALGLRGLRRSLRDTELFKLQLRAILRASSIGPTKLMFPMLTSEDELQSALVVLNQAKSELIKEDQAFDDTIAIGAMIEVPASALAANQFAKNLDFLSIGTNDLIQYTLAIDRIDEAVNYLYDPLHPAVLQLIHLTLKAGQRAGIPVSMCGEMAGDIRYTKLLLGMGLREFSTHPASLLEVKSVINATDVSALEKRCKDILNKHISSAKIHHLVDQLNL